MFLILYFNYSEALQILIQWLNMKQDRKDGAIACEKEL